MKNIKEKARKIKDRVSKKTETRESQIAKITNTTLEEQRKEILNKGKKFKYPVQYSKNRLVSNFDYWNRFTLVSALSSAKHK